MFRINRCLLLTFLILGGSFALQAQVACGYRFEYTAAISYQPLPVTSPTLIIASGADKPSVPDDISPTDEDFFPNQQIGFPFTFNGVTYQQLGIATNGWIWFGKKNPFKAAGLVIPFTNILATDHDLEGVVSALNADLEGRWNAEPATISTRLSGSAPNRTFTIEWKNFKALDDAEGTGYCGENRNRFDFQIILEESGGTISIAYNAAYCWQGYQQLFQVGLRGIKPEDVHTRSIPAGQQAWENSQPGLNHSTAIIRSSSPVTTPPANARFIFRPYVPQPLIWIGINSNWFDQSNWSGGQIPGRCNDVRIPKGKNYYPQLTGNLPAECGSLVLEEGAALDLKANYKSFLSVYGDLTNEGVISNHTSSYITLAGGAANNISGKGYFLSTDLNISAGAQYNLKSDLVIRNLFINEGASLSLSSHVLDVFSIFQHGTLKQGTGTLVIEGSQEAVRMNDSTFFAEAGTTFFGSGEVWSDLTDQTVPSLNYHNLWVRTNKYHKVQLGSDKDFSCNNLLFYNPGEPGGQALTATNIKVQGDFKLGIDSLPGTALSLNHTITSNKSGGQFRMGNKDNLIITYASGTKQTAIGGFATPKFSGGVTYSGNEKQNIASGTYQNLTLTGTAQRTIHEQVNLRGILKIESGTLITNDSLTLTSDSINTALISGKGAGNISGYVELERYIHGTGNQHIMFGSAFELAALSDYASDIPVLGPDGVQFSTTPSPTVWEYRSDLQDTDFLSAWYSRTKLHDQIVAGAGLMGRVQGGAVIRAKGKVNAGKIRVPLRVNAAAINQPGFNLVSNPYPAPIDWNLLVQQNAPGLSRCLNKQGSGNRFNGQFATWLPLATGEGLGINGATGYIGAQEGFFIRAFKNDTLEFTDQCRVEVLNTRSVTVPEVIPYVRLSLNQGGKADELVVYFSGINSNFEAIDGKDAFKMKPYAGPLSYWYSIKDSVNLAIQGRRSIDCRDSVNLGFYAANAGACQVRLAEAQHFPATAMIFLEDKKTGAFINLRKQSAVDLSLEPGEEKGRFVLHFRPGVKVTPFAENCNGKNGRIAFSNMSSAAWDVSVFNGNDSLVFSQNTFTGTHQLGDLQAGEYRVHFKLSGQNLEVDEWVSILPGNSVKAFLHAATAEVITGQTVLFSASGNAEAWFWSFGDGMLASGDSIREHQFHEPGIYPVVLTATKGECADTAVVQIHVSAVNSANQGISQDRTTFSIYPNPATTIANLRLRNEKPLSNAALYLVDANGRIAVEKKYQRIEPDQVIELPVGQLAKGNYEVVVHAGAFKSVSRLSVAGK